jgi:hypothetical protein
MSNKLAPEGAHYGWVYGYTGNRTSDGKFDLDSQKIDICTGVDENGQEEHELFSCREVGKFTIDIGVVIEEVTDDDGYTHSKLRVA